MAKDRTYHLFLSHSWRRSQEYERLVALLNAHEDFIFKNYSVPKDKAIQDATSSKELYDAIKIKMASCHAITVMAGVYAIYSGWIKKEVRIAKCEFKEPKTVIAVKPWRGIKISAFVAANADAITQWKKEAIISAIQKHCRAWS